MQERLRILHLSDLHYSAKQAFDIGVVSDALRKDIEGQVKDAPLDLAIFTGDLVQAGETAEEFQEALDKFLMPVLRSANLEADKLILTPGNHDIAREIVRAKPWVDRGLLETLNSRESISRQCEWLLKQVKPDDVTARLDNYDAFRKSAGLAVPSEDKGVLQIYHHALGRYKIGVAALNTAWRATGEDQDIDRGRLIIGERFVDLCERGLDGCDLKIAAYHHPLDWLADVDRRDVEPRMLGLFDALLYGHMHSQNPEMRVSVYGSVLNCQSASIYQGRSFYNGYQIVEIDLETNTFAVFLREYRTDPSRSFHPAEGLIANGVFKGSLKPASSGSADERSRRFLGHARGAIRVAASEATTLVKKDGKLDDIKDTFVCPPLMKRSDAIASIYVAGKMPDGSLMTEAELLRSEGPIAILGQRESGKTSLAHFLAVRASEETADRVRVPVVLDATTIPPGRRMVERAIKGYFADLLGEGIELPPVDDIHHLFLIDNFNINDANHKSLINTIKEHYKTSRIIYFTSSDLMMRDAQAIKAWDDRITCIYIGALPRRSMRQITQLRLPRLKITDEVNGLHNTIVQHVSAIGLPRSGYIVTLLLYAIEAGISLEHINEATLVQNIIDILLNKMAPEDISRSQFDAKSKELLLQELAQHLSTDAIPDTDYNELLGRAISFLKSRNLPFSADEIVAGLIRRGILYRSSGNRVSFRYRVFAEYFRALHLRDNPEKVSEIITQNTLVENRRELDLLTGISRVSGNLIPALTSYLENVIPGRYADSVGYDPSVLGFDTRLRLISPQRLKTLQDARLTGEQIDNLLDEADNRAKRENKSAEVERAKASGGISADAKPSFTKFVLATSLLGRIVRNSEGDLGHIKKDALCRYFDLQAKTLGHLLGEVQRIIEERGILEDVKKSEAPVGEGEAPKPTETAKPVSQQQSREGRTRVVLSMLNLIAPIAWTTLHTSDVSSPKLAITLHQIAMDRELPTATRFFAALLLVSTKSSLSVEACIELIDEFHRKPLMLSCIFEHVYHEYEMGLPSLDLARGWERVLSRLLQTWEVKQTSGEWMQRIRRRSSKTQTDAEIEE